METITTIRSLRDHLGRRRDDGATLGFVPTMGYLHRGHLTLIEHAAAAHDEIVVSIFVNPLQFAANEDLSTYPRDPDGDAARAAAAGATTLFTPSEDEMYPRGRDAVATSVSVAPLSATMEGASRRTHFAGVCTVVAKLFNIVGPCAAYFGEKDYQQLAIVRRMASDLSFPVEVVGVPTVREDDGLAMSSRNAYLSEAERAAAPVLNRALRTGADLVLSGETDADAVRIAMRNVVEGELAGQGLGELDYLEIADPETLEPVVSARPGQRLFGAVRFGRARLIDNVGIDADGDAT